MLILRISINIIGLIIDETFSPINAPSIDLAIGLAI